MKRDLKQLDKLEQYLKDNNIPYERFDKEDVISPQFPYYIETHERHQIYVPNGKNSEWDVICQWGSYGAEDGLLEIYGSIVDPNAGDTVEGCLTADDVIERIERKKRMSVLIKGMKMPKEGKVMAIYKLNGEFFASFNGAELYPLVNVGDIIEAPTIDAVRVIRCKDCKHSEEAGIPDRELWCNIHEIFMTVNYFCAEGERRQR